MKTFIFYSLVIRLALLTEDKALIRQHLVYLLERREEHLHLVEVLESAGVDVSDLKLR